MQLSDKTTVGYKRPFGMDLRTTNDLLLFLFKESPRYFRSALCDKRVDFGDEVDADAWEILGGGFVYVTVGSNPNKN
jgi:hypothetical protein